MPTSYSVKDILAGIDRLYRLDQQFENLRVLKFINYHRGENKFVVSSPGDILDLLSQRKLSSVVEIPIPSQLELHRRKILEVVGKWDGLSSGEDMLIAGGGGLTAQEALYSLMIREYLRIEDFIQSPTFPITTNLRIVADAFGRVHYSQLHYTNFEENSDPSQIKFLTNRLAGGKVILLDSMHTIPTPRGSLPELEQHILHAHQLIETDSQQLKDLQQLTARIAYINRFQHPFTGCDFMLNRADNIWLMLEANPGPSLNPDALGVDSDNLTKNQAVQLYELLRGPRF